MDPRLAVHAGSHRQKVRAWIAAAVVLAAASPAAAAPKGAKAKAAFDRGVVAYQKGEFAAASDALATSFKLEADVETLFAWAQSERQLDHCDKAVELFEKLLTFDLPAENKKVIQSKIDECKTIIAAKQPRPPEKPPEKPPEQPPEKPPEVARVDPPDRAAPIRVEEPATGPERSPWWKDPIGDGLVGLGAVGLGVGTYFWMKGVKTREDATEANFEDEFPRAKNQATIGVVSVIAGGALVVGGIVRYATRGGGKERSTVTGWLSPDGGGITAIGRF